ncbi:MAG: type II toxin-antitoxin system MqsA family antitoxin [Blastocatellia bacterium]
MEIDRNKLSERFFNLRKKLDLTQQEISELFGVGLRTWQSWEHAETTPFSKYLKLLNQYEKTPPKLLRFSDMCRIVRFRLGKKKYQMAAIFDVAPNTWGYWEKGKMKPSNEFIEKIKQMYQEIMEQENLPKVS